MPGRKVGNTPQKKEALEATGLCPMQKYVWEHQENIVEYI